MDVNTTLLQQLAIALGLGLLVGLQRQWATTPVAGIRTFALITVLGAVCGALSGFYGGWILVAGILSLTAFLVLGNIAARTQDRFDPGMTTEVAAVLMFAVGAMVTAGMTAPAVVVGGLVAVLLHWKEPMHRFVERFSGPEMRAVYQVVLIALVILPLLPDRTFGPYNVLNPYKIWLMVALICGISVVGYIAHQFLGARVGTLLAGILGGVISSTATTVSFARRTRDDEQAVGASALVIMIASTISFVRVAVEVAVVAPAMVPRIVPQLAGVTAFMALLCVGLYFRQRQDIQKSSPEGDPSGLKTALVFALLYAVVLFIIAAVKNHFAHEALYAVAVISGMTDMDAITLSTAQLMNEDRLNPDTGWRMILLAGMANMVFKAGIVATTGHRKLFALIAGLLGASAIFGAGILMWWPASLP